MSSIDLIAVGKLKNDPLADVFADYQKRMTWKFALRELEGKTQADANAKIMAQIDPKAALIILDERGKSLSSRDFAAKIESWQTAFPKIQFVIGGADGLSDDIRKKATMLMSFGAQTWPHMMARVMLMEQIYRAQAIIANHPYHRD